MILTVTANPSLDRTVRLEGPLVPGQVHRLVDSVTVAAGKGVNISAVLHAAGAATLAVVPAGADDPLLAGLVRDGVPHLGVPVTGPVRINLTVTAPDGTTTKFNEPGARLDGPQLRALEQAVLAAALNGAAPSPSPIRSTGPHVDAGSVSGSGSGAKAGLREESAPAASIGLDASVGVDAANGSGTAAGSGGRAGDDSPEWVVMTGSLPPGVPADWYASMVARLREQLGLSGVRIAVDTSDAPLAALVSRCPECAPDLIAPNSTELAQVCGGDGAQMEASAAGGDLSAVIEAARTLVGKGIREVLVTLGGAGALLVGRDSSWHVVTGPVDVRSTVGAGDAALAGLLLARDRGADAPTALRTAVAYGTAAVCMPGTGRPSAEQAAAVSVSVNRCR